MKPWAPPRYIRQKCGSAEVWNRRREEAFLAWSQQRGAKEPFPLPTNHRLSSSHHVNREPVISSRPTKISPNPMRNGHLSRPRHIHLSAGELTAVHASDAMRYLRCLMPRCPGPGMSQPSNRDIKLRCSGTTRARSSVHNHLGKDATNRQLIDGRSGFRKTERETERKTERQTESGCVAEDPEGRRHCVYKNADLESGPHYRL